MKNKEKRSKWWDKLCEILEQEFPKNQCKERGHALVLLAYAEMYLQEAEKEKEKLYDWCFKKCGEECEKAIKFEKEKLLERIGLKDKGSTIEIPVSKENLLDEGELYNMRTQKEASFKQGYNQAIEDLEKLKEEIKKEL